MKIIFQYFTGGGGALSNIILLLQAYAKTFPDDHITIVCSNSSDLKNLGGLPNVDVMIFGSSNNQEIDRLKLGFGGLRRISEDIGADIVWSLNVGSYVRLDAPNILSVNNPHQVYPWKVTRYHPKSSLRVAALRWFFRRSLRFSDGVIVQTPLMASYVSALEEAPSDICVVPKSVEDTDDVQATPLPAEISHTLDSGLGREAFTFLYVATYVPHKNHKTLVGAFEQLALQKIPVRVVLTISTEELLAFGGEKASQLMKSGHIIPIGWTKKEYLKALYDSCNGCLMPSVLESLSSANLEAMQWNKPQIVADVPFARDLCGDAAIYVPAEDPLSWSDKISEFILNKELQMKLVAEGQKKMKQFPLTWNDSAHKVRAFFKDIINKKLDH